MLYGRKCTKTTVSHSQKGSVVITQARVYRTHMVLCVETELLWLLVMFIRLVIFILVYCTYLILLRYQIIL